MLQLSLQDTIDKIEIDGGQSMSPVAKEVRFERCPNCGSVVLFKDTDVTTCPRCKLKIRLKK